jgi:hypothetical protein
VVDVVYIFLPWRVVRVTDIKKIEHRFGLLNLADSSVGVTEYIIGKPEVHALQRYITHVMVLTFSMQVGGLNCAVWKEPSKPFVLVVRSASLRFGEALHQAAAAPRYDKQTILYIPLYKPPFTNHFLYTLHDVGLVS